MEAIVQKKDGDFSVVIQIGERTLKVCDVWSDIRNSKNKADEVARELNDHLEHFVGNAKKRKTKKILIIDDDKHLTKTLRYFIEDEGHTCYQMHDTDEIKHFWSFIESSDIIILGLMMLKGDSFLKEETEKEKHLEVGEILYNRIRKQHPKKNIVILTAMNKEEIAIDIGITTFIQKPLIESKLIQLLKYIG